MSYYPRVPLVSPRRRARQGLQHLFIISTLVLVFYSSARLLAIRVLTLSGLSAETLEGAWLKTYVEVIKSHDIL